jgi:DNA-binding IscR family transcriptional regulator
MPASLAGTLSSLSKPQGGVTGALGAAGNRVSKNHLTKVVHRLAQQGYLETVRGNSAGIRLAREPKKIFMGR